MNIDSAPGVPRSVSLKRTVPIVIIRAAYSTRRVLAALQSKGDEVLLNGPAVSMCGRFTLRTPLKTVAFLFDLSEDAVDAAAGRSPRFNIAPSQEIAAVRHRVAGNPAQLVWLRWGLVPHWADAPDTAPP